MIIAFLWPSLLLLASGHFIKSVAINSSQVGTPSTISLLIATNTTLSQLDITISNSFTILNPLCSVNATIVQCSKIVPATGAKVSVRFSGLALATNS